MEARSISRGVLDALSGLPLFATAPLLRRWHLRWGATDEEVRAPMPGDDIIPEASFNGTRAITIDASPEMIWPWIVQMGYRRVGFYNLRGARQRRLRERGSRRGGVPVPEGGRLDAHGEEGPRDHRLQGEGLLDERVAPWDKPGSTWSWRLVPLEGGRTRVITRLKQRYAWETPVSAFLRMLLLEFGDFPMMRRVLKGIKLRAEGMARSRGGDFSAEAEPVSLAERGVGP